MPAKAILTNVQVMVTLIVVSPKSPASRSGTKIKIENDITTYLGSQAKSHCIQWLQFFLPALPFSVPAVSKFFVVKFIPKHLYDFLLSVPTTTIQVKATVSVEFNRKTNFIPDSLNKAFNEKANVGVWSAYGSNKAEREQEQEVGCHYHSCSQCPHEDTVLPKPSESPRGSRCG